MHLCSTMSLLSDRTLKHFSRVGFNMYLILLKQCIWNIETRTYLYLIEKGVFVFWEKTIWPPMFYLNFSWYPFECAFLWRFGQVTHDSYMITEFLTHPKHDFTPMGRVDGWLGKTLTSTLDFRYGPQIWWRRCTVPWNKSLFKMAMLGQFAFSD